VASVRPEASDEPCPGFTPRNAGLFLPGLIEIRVHRLPLHVCSVCLVSPSQRRVKERP
jgi:hypothetical protein